MKLTYLSLLFAIFLTIQAEVSWYAGDDRNVTCTGHDNGHISCTPGHEAGAAEVSLPSAEDDTKRDSVTIRGREVALPALEKRVTCNIDGVTKGLSCFTHCFLLNYCNSHCDSNNICHCDCYDESPWYELPCSVTTCA